MGDREELNRITEAIIGSAIDVHRALGPGLLESAYEKCLAFELARRGLRVEQQKGLPLEYKGLRVDCGYRVDLLVDRAVVVEVKAVEELGPIHKAQLLSYLRLSGCKVGLIMNFNVRLMKQGIVRLIQGDFAL